MKRIWLDTDIGTDIDDALALAYLARRPDVDIVGVSVVGCDTMKRALLARKILRLAGRDDVRVFRGLGDSQLPGESDEAFQYRREHQAVSQSFFLSEACDLADLRGDLGEVNAPEEIAQHVARDLTLVCIGQRSNLSAAIGRSHRDILGDFESVWLMGGESEYNARMDADAHRAVMVAAWSNLFVVPGPGVTWSHPFRREEWKPHASEEGFEARLHGSY